MSNVHYPTVSRCRLHEFPGYTAYRLYVDLASDPDRFNLLVQKGCAEVSLSNHYGCDYYNEKPKCLLPHSNDYYYYDVNGIPMTVNDGSRLYVSSRCNIPLTLLKKYNVVTSISQDSPEYIVLPSRINAEKIQNYVKVYVNHNSMTVLTLALPDFDHYRRVMSLEAWPYLESIKNSLVGTIPDLEGFESYESDVMFDVRSFPGEDSYLYLHGMFPRNRIVNEKSLIVGDGYIDYDILKSCFIMFGSSDAEMRKTALYTLAQYDCREYQELLRWMFNCDYDSDRVVYDVKKGNKPFSWLHRMVTDNGEKKRLWHMRQASSRNAAMKLINDLTNGTLIRCGTPEQPWVATKDFSNIPNNNRYRQLIRVVG